MKVALLGAPGSGKTKFARKLSQHLNTELPPWKPIDGYVEKLTKRVGHPFGPIFDRTAFRCNLQVLAERWTLEDEAREKGYNTISCGSIFETIIYAAAQSIPLHQYPEDLMVFESHVAQTMMASLGLLSLITYDYDALFYLPLADPPETISWISVVDAKLDEVLTGQYKEAIVLDGTSKQRIEKATSAITAIEEAREDYQRRVEQNRVTSERQEPGPEPVPNVPE